MDDESCVLNFIEIVPLNDRVSQSTELKVSNCYMLFVHDSCWLVARKSIRAYEL